MAKYFYKLQIATRTELEEGILNGIAKCPLCDVEKEATAAPEKGAESRVMIAAAGKLYPHLTIEHQLPNIEFHVDDEDV